MPTPDLVTQGQVRWYDFGTAVGSEPQGRRPVLVIQGDELNHSRFRTTVIAAVTSRMGSLSFPGAVFLPAVPSGLPRDSVVQLWAVTTVNKWSLGPIAGVVPTSIWPEIEQAMDQVMGRAGGVLVNRG
jgi:mRNA interferase MazF